MTDWIIAIASILAVIFSGINFWLLKKRLILENKQKTLEFVCREFNHLAEIGARSLYNKARGEETIQDFLTNNNCTSDDEQKFLEYVYVFNRIGYGVYAKALDEKTVFNIWAPQYFITNWHRFESFVKRKRNNNANAYSYFDWLAKNHCPNLINAYPEKRPIT